MVDDDNCSSSSSGEAKLARVVTATLVDWNELEELVAVLEVALGSSNDRKKYLASLSTSSSSTRSTLGVDVEVDVEVDAEVEAAVDAEVKAAVDAEVDVEVDAAVDAEVDAAVDAEVEAEVDVEVEAVALLKTKPLCFYIHSTFWSFSKHIGYIYLFSSTRSKKSQDIRLKNFKHEAS